MSYTQVASLSTIVRQLPAGRIDILSPAAPHRHRHAFFGEVGGKAFSRYLSDYAK